MPRLEWSPIHSTGLETWTTGAHRDYNGSTYYWYGVVSYVTGAKRAFLLTSCFLGHKNSSHVSVKAAQRAAKTRLQRFMKDAPPEIKR